MTASGRNWLTWRQEPGYPIRGTAQGFPRTSAGSHISVAGYSIQHSQCGMPVCQQHLNVLIDNKSCYKLRPVYIPVTKTNLKFVRHSQGEKRSSILSAGLFPRLEASSRSSQQVKGSKDLGQPLLLCPGTLAGNRTRRGSQDSVAGSNWSTMSLLNF